MTGLHELSREPGAGAQDEHGADDERSAEEIRGR